MKTVADVVAQFDVAMKELTEINNARNEEVKKAEEKIKELRKQQDFARKESAKATRVGKRFGKLLK